MKRLKTIKFVILSLIPIAIVISCTNIYKAASGFFYRDGLLKWCYFFQKQLHRTVPAYGGSYNQAGANSTALTYVKYSGEVCRITRIHVNSL